MQPAETTILPKKLNPQGWGYLLGSPKSFGFGEHGVLGDGEEEGVADFEAGEALRVGGEGADSIVYSDTFGSYDVLDVAGSRHLRINHARLFSEEKNHINGIENFWNQAKRHLRPNPAILPFLGVQQASQDLLRTSGPGCLA
jgi:hypothetical protein